MLKLIVPGIEMYDEVKNEFSYTKDTVIQLEHSLVSVSKWESKWKKSFLNTKNKTNLEMLDYIKCMCITQNIADDVFRGLTSEQFEIIDSYINDPMTATKIKDDNNKGGPKDAITSELIYYWMISLQIPMECQKWHLNRLLTLINVCNIKNTPPKKMSKSDLYSRHRSVNAMNRAKYHKP